MDIENEYMPRTEVNFAPTNAFIGTFGEEEATRESQAFTSETWAQNLSAKSEPTKQRDDGKEVKERMVQLAVEMSDRRRNAIVLSGGIFGAGVVVGWLLYKHFFIE
jgi:hypothetical protein